MEVDGGSGVVVLGTGPSVEVEEGQTERRREQGGCQIRDVLSVY